MTPQIPLVLGELAELAIRNAAPDVADGVGAPDAGYQMVVSIDRDGAPGAPPLAGSVRDGSVHTSLRVPTARLPTGNGCRAATAETSLAAIDHSRRATRSDAGTASSGPRSSLTATIPYVWWTRSTQG